MYKSTPLNIILTISVFLVMLCVTTHAAGVIIYVDADAAGANNGSSWAKTACTSFAAGRLATVDGCAMSGHTCEGNSDFTLKVVPGRTHKPGEMFRIDYPGIAGGFKHIVRGETKIPQAPVTYTYFHTECPIANEYQVFFGENTCATRKELRSLSPEEALLDWTQVAVLALQRGKTAREAIKAVGALLEKFGLNGVGESFLVSDPNEAWCLEIPGFTNEWIAQRIPDEHVCPHANRMRIGEIDPDNPDYFMVSQNLIKTAQEKGLYDAEKDGPFNFAKVYCGNKSMLNRRREWRILSLLCPSKEWDPNAITYPFSVKPDKKISVHWWIDNVWRDHLEGTAYDKTKGIAAGPFGCPGRAHIYGVSFERSICVAETAYAWVSQARGWLPNSIGGVIWFGLDCPRSTCFVPFYVGISQTPNSWQCGDYSKFSEESARWYFQAIDTFSWLRYNEMHADVRAVFDPIEAEEYAVQSDIEKKAVELYKLHPYLAREFLTKYSNDCATKAGNAARDLFYFLIAKYADGRPNTTVSQEWKEMLNKK